MTSPAALSLYERIKRKNKHKPVTIDDLIEWLSFERSQEIIDLIKELRSDGLITTRMVTNHGRFENELIPRDDFIDHFDEKLLERISRIPELDPEYHFGNEEEEEISPKKEKKEKKVIRPKKKLKVRIKRR